MATVATLDLAAAAARLFPRHIRKQQTPGGEVVVSTVMFVGARAKIKRTVNLVRTRNI
jgi:hypothetical protein